MKKLLILFSFLFVFILKINAYEYEVAEDYNSKNWFYLNEHSGKLEIKALDISNNGISYSNINTQTSKNLLATIRRNSSNSIGQNGLMQLFKEDNNFLNDFITQGTQPLLNYFYNLRNDFNVNFINYTNYNILYDESGLAVEFVVNGVWKGLYNTEEEINNSGWLYDKNSKTYYSNGVEASYIKTLVKIILGKYQNTIKAMFALNVLGAVLVLIAVISILRICIRLLHHALSRTRLNINIGKHF